MAHILVIEDEQATRYLLRDVLEQEGHEVREACNGQEGIEHYRVSPADIVITDIIMPEKEGLETIRELCREFPQVKIIAMSESTMSLHVDLLGVAKQLGAVSTLHKPFQIHEIVKVVNETVKS